MKLLNLKILQQHNCTEKRDIPYRHSQIWIYWQQQRITPFIDDGETHLYPVVWMKRLATEKFHFR